MSALRVGASVLSLTPPDSLPLPIQLFLGSATVLYFLSLNSCCCSPRSGPHHPVLVLWQFDLFLSSPIHPLQSAISSSKTYTFPPENMSLASHFKSSGFQHLPHNEAPFVASDLYSFLPPLQMSCFLWTNSPLLPLLMLFP